MGKAVSRSARHGSVDQGAVGYGNEPSLIIHERGLDGAYFLDNTLGTVHRDAVPHLIELTQIYPGDDLADRIPATQPHGQSRCSAEGNQHDGNDGIEQLRLDL